MILLVSLILASLFLGSIVGYQLKNYEPRCTHDWKFLGSTKTNIYWSSEDKYPSSTVWRRTYMCLKCKEGMVKENNI